jgi:hypothetical protein
MSKFTAAVLLASLLSGSAWSEVTSRVPAHRPTTKSRPPLARPAPPVIFRDPLLGSVRMRPVHTPTAVVAFQRPAVSVAQITAVRPGSWR